jgi:hypothetical protein
VATADDEDVVVGSHKGNSKRGSRTTESKNRN